MRARIACTPGGSNPVYGRGLLYHPARHGNFAVSYRTHNLQRTSSSLDPTMTRLWTSYAAMQRSVLFTAVANCGFSEARFPQELLRASRVRPEAGAVEPRALRHVLSHIQVQSARCGHSLVLHVARHTRLLPRLPCPQQPRGASPRLSETQATPPTAHTLVLEPAT